MSFLFQGVGLFLLASSPSNGSSEGPNMVQTFVFMGLIFVVFWFFMIRPQKQKQKQRSAMLKALDKGDRIATIGGIRGTVAKVSDDVVSVKIDSNCKVDFSRSAIAEVILDEQETALRVEAAKAENKKTESKKATEKDETQQDKGEEGGA